MAKVHHYVIRFLSLKLVIAPYLYSKIIYYIIIIYIVLNIQYYQGLIIPLHRFSELHMFIREVLTMSQEVMCILFS